jgi:hypothetical protein
MQAIAIIVACILSAVFEALASRVPSEKHLLFLADGWAHSASYVVGFVGGIVVIVKVWRSRDGL